MEDKLTGAATEQKVRILKIRKAAAAAAEAIARLPALAGLPGLPGPRAYVVLVGDSG